MQKVLSKCILFVFFGSMAELLTTQFQTDERRPTKKQLREINKETKKQWEEEHLQQKEQTKNQNSKDNNEYNM